MITMSQVKQAMELLHNPKMYRTADSQVRWLARCLDLNERVKDYNGTLESAIECLTYGGYEIV